MGPISRERPIRAIGMSLSLLDALKSVLDAGERFVYLLVSVLGLVASLVNEERRQATIVKSCRNSLCQFSKVADRNAGTACIAEMARASNWYASCLPLAGHGGRYA